ncbi:MAG: hypothetical protein AAGK05_07245 [Pseudomonadota bacterium]
MFSEHRNDVKHEALQRGGEWGQRGTSDGNPADRRKGDHACEVKWQLVG